jgi:hypothetical protein
VTLNFGNALTGTSNSNLFRMTGLPANLQPATLPARSGVMVASDNGTPFYTAFMEIDPGTGTIQFYYNANGMNWTSSGVKSMNQNQTFTYLLT